MPTDVLSRSPCPLVLLAQKYPYPYRRGGRGGQNQPVEFHYFVAWKPWDSDPTPQMDFSCKTAAQSTRVCNADLLATTLLPSKLNTTSFQGAPACLGFPSMRFSAMHFCGPLLNMAFRA